MLNDNKSTIYSIEDSIILKIPSHLSVKLPSRGLAMAKIVVNGNSFLHTLEPDGLKGHCLILTPDLLKIIKAKIGDEVEVNVEVTQEWIEPTIPDDLDKALRADRAILKLWQEVSPAARWEWIRWINSTKNIVTRNTRIDVGFDKLRNGSKRPCCFNASVCTHPSISKNGILLDY